MILDLWSWKTSKQSKQPGSSKIFIFRAEKLSFDHPSNPWKDFSTNPNLQGFEYRVQKTFKKFKELFGISVKPCLQVGFLAIQIGNLLMQLVNSFKGRLKIGLLEGTKSWVSLRKPTMVEHTMGASCQRKARRKSAVGSGIIYAQVVRSKQITVWQ